MAFDIAKLDARTPHDKGSDMPVKGPDGRVLLGDDGEPVTIGLKGRYSQAAQQLNRDQINRRLAKQAKGESTLRTAADFEDENIELLVAVTARWSFTELDGQPFPFTPQNAKTLWSDPRFIPIREQALTWVNIDGNFTLG